MEIYLNKIEDVLKNFPERQDFAFNRACNIFVCSLGFEERTHHLISKLAETQDLTDCTVVIIRYPTNEEENEKNFSVYEGLKEKFKKIESIQYSKKDFSRNFNSLIKQLVGEGETSEVIFDISTCASYVFYPVMKSQFDQNLNLTIGYVEAIDYYPKLEEFKETSKKAELEGSFFPQAFENASFQSHGVDDVYSSSLFAELNPGNTPTLMVAVPNFSPVRMNSIIFKDQEINGTKIEDVCYLLGQPPDSKNHWRTDAIKIANNLNDSQIFKSISTRSYSDIVSALEEIWVEHQFKYHLSIGNLGSKMQHLGAFLFLMLHPDVSLWLAEPSKFKAMRFSEGVGDSWQVEFGDVQNFAKEMRSYLTYRWDF